MPHTTRHAPVICHAAFGNAAFGNAAVTIRWTPEAALWSALYRTNRLKRAAGLAVARLLGDVCRRLGGPDVRRPEAGPARGAAARGATAPTRPAGVTLRSLETLEGRQLLSATGSVTFSGGTLTVTGNPKAGADLSVQLSSNGKQITGNAGNGQIVSETLSSVKAVVVTGGTGADTIYVDTRVTIPVTINGGGGNDQIRGGGGVNTIYVPSGNAWVSTRGSASYVKAGDGNVTLLGGGGNDTLIAGNGNDSLDGANGNDSMVAGNGNDTVTGDSGNDTLVVGNGNDSLSGGLGDDKIVTGSGTTVVVPGAGNNTVQVGGKGTTIAGTSGKNTLEDSTGAIIAGTSNQVTGGPLAVQWVTTAATAATGTAPQAVIQVLNPAAETGAGVVFNGLTSKLGAGSTIDANYQWNFGDPSGAHDALAGFNASHVYDTAGTYTVSLTVTNVDGQTSTAHATVTVGSDARHVIYVNGVTGNDANNGSTPATAVKTAARGGNLVGNNTELLFARGQTFDLASAIQLKYSNVLVGAYGSGALPVINFTNPVATSVLFTTNSGSAVAVTIQDLEMTTLLGVGFSTMANPPMAVNVGGYDTVVRGCTFEDVGYAVDGVGNPVGLSVIDNSAPVKNTINGYFVWGQGQDLVIVGNTAEGSVHEHIVRNVGVSEQLVADNNFYNGDGKGCIEIHEGSFAWIDHNTVTGGDIRVGPRGGETEAASTITAYCVIQDNQAYGTDIRSEPGSEHVSIRDNVITTDDADCITLEGQDGSGRQSADVRVSNNTGIDTGDSGQFLKVNSYVNGITVQDNLYVAPTMSVGSQGTAPVYVVAGSLAGFTTVTNNVWQSPRSTNGWANGGINFMATSYVNTGELTAAKWNALPQVGTDDFTTTSLNTSTFAPATNSVAATAGMVVAGVYGDINGDARPTSGKWSAGAVQV